MTLIRLFMPSSTLVFIGWTALATIDTFDVSWQPFGKLLQGRDARVHRQGIPLCPTGSGGGKHHNVPFALIT